MSICVGDIIELEPESNLNKLAKIIEIKKGKIEAIDLSTSKLVILPVDYLYDKQDITGSRLKPSEERELGLLGAKNLWIKLTPEQYKKYNLTNKKNEYDIQKEKELDEIQIKFLSDLFKNSKNEETKINIEEIKIFETSQKQEKKLKNNSPLSKFIRKKEI